MGRFAGDKYFVGDYIFQEEYDTGGCCSPYDYNIWITHKTNKKFSACRTWHNGEVPNKKHLQNFFNKFARDEEYRKKYIK